MPRAQDLLTFVSTTGEAAYGTAVDKTDMDLRFNFGTQFPGDEANVDILNVCGGRHPTGGQVLTVDRPFTMEGRLYPTNAAWLASYALGAYTVTGAGDPYTHKAVPLAAGDYDMDSFTFYKAYDAAGTYFQFKGSQFDTFSIQGSADGGNAALTFNAAGRNDGSRVEVVSYTEAECDPDEACYRFADVTPTLGPFGGSALSGITSKFMGFTVNVTNNQQTDPRRSGTTVAEARENGTESYTINLTFKGSPSDQIDDLWQATLGGTPGYVACTLTCANPVTNRVMVITARKAVIENLAPGNVSSNNSHAHQITLRCVQDYTDSTSRAESPLKITVQNAIPTFRAS